MKKIRWTLNIAAILMISVPMVMAMEGITFDASISHAVISAFALCLIVSSGLDVYERIQDHRSCIKPLSTALGLAITLILFWLKG